MTNLNSIEIKQRIQRIMQNHIGRKYSLPRRELLLRLELPPGADRQVRQLIGELRREYFPILFATDKPYGYYLPANETERLAGIEKLKSYVKDECITIRALKTGGSRFINGDKQLEMI